MIERKLKIEVKLENDNTIPVEVHLQSDVQEVNHEIEV